MKILIIDDIHELLVEGLKEAGHDLRYMPEAAKADLPALIANVEGLVIRSKVFADKALIDRAPRLKFIARAGSGMDNVDEVYAYEKGIVCLNAGEANADAVGEHALGMLLSLLHKLAKADAEVRKGIWDREGNRGHELKGKTVGIIGYGNTGKVTAAKLSGFGVKVLAYDKYLKNYGDHFAAEAGMEEIFEGADIVSFHIPLTHETAQMIDEAYLDRFAKPLYVLNMCRGGILNTGALISKIRQGRVLGAALDVLENEKIDTLSNPQQQDFDFLTKSEKVVLAPHIGGWTIESYRKISEVLLEKISNLKLEK